MNRQSSIAIQAAGCKRRTDYTTHSEPEKIYRELLSKSASCQIGTVWGRGLTVKCLSLLFCEERHDMNGARREQNFFRECVLSSLTSVVQVTVWFYLRLFPWLRHSYIKLARASDVCWVPRQRNPARGPTINRRVGERFGARPTVGSCLYSFLFFIFILSIADYSRL